MSNARDRIIAIACRMLAKRGVKRFPAAGTICARRG